MRLRSLVRRPSRLSSLYIVPCCLLILLAASTALLPAQEVTGEGDALLDEYFRQQTRQLDNRPLAEIETLEQWEAKRDEYRSQLLEMLGLEPMPERTDLKARITGEVDGGDFVVERIQFQSRPNLYVTGSLFRPKQWDKPLPAVLYVCGHGRVKIDGVSYGNKATYQHHGAWFARNGYACLMIDTLQLGEIEGIHHGTYSHDRWWWLSRGYTPAGVEAWNSVRALDYLQSRKELVDPERLGVTGRSGGGAYSWWIAAIDERIKAAVPVAGITDLENHVVDGCVEGHCDCMFMVNTFQWDYPMVAALVAPRPLLISNTDQDRIFPLDGVVRTYTRARKIYELYGAGDDIGLHITAGGHKDTQELRIHAFRWMNRHLKDDESLISITAEKFFEPQQLKVLAETPADERNTSIDQTFVETAKVAEVESAEQWEQLRDQWKRQLLEKSFRGWPSEPAALEMKEAYSVTQEGLRLRAIDFTSQQPYRLRLYLLHADDLETPELTVLNVVDEQGWDDFLATVKPGFGEQFSDDEGEGNPEAFDQTRQMLKNQPWVMAYVAPRGIGPTAWTTNERKQTQYRRRFYLLGQSLDGMRVWDVRRAIAALRSAESAEGTRTSSQQAPLWLQSSRAMGGVALYASLFEDGIARLDLHDLPASHDEGPYFLNVRRILDLPQAVALAAERSKVVLYTDAAEAWQFARDLGEQLGWKSPQVRPALP